MKGAVIGAYQAVTRTALTPRTAVAVLAFERIRCGMANGTSIDAELKTYAVTKYGVTLKS